MKKLPLIRHIRYFIALARFEKWWRTMGGYYIAPNPKDLQYLEDIRTGKI